MKNAWVYQLKSRVRLKITGKNIERFIKKLHIHKIELLQITYPKRNEAVIEIYKQDYERVMELKTVYEVSIVGIKGALKIKKMIKMNRFLIIGLVLGLGVLLFLSNIIYKIEIVHTNKEIRTLLLEELKAHGIYEKSFKKNFHQLEKIKNDIVNQHRDKIEWLEIETVGTKYVVRVEMRKIVTPNQETGLGNIVASKGAIIRKVEASNGEIVRNKGDYVSPGDVVISGEIKLNEETVNYTNASGKVYGEVWYKTTVTYPFYYYEKKETGKKRTVLVIRLFHHEWTLFGKTLYQEKKIEQQKQLKHLFLPFSISIERQREVEVIEEMNTEEEAMSKAMQYARKKMEQRLKEKEEIIDQKSLKVDIKNSKIVMDIFFTIQEDITSYQKIEKPQTKESK